MSILGVQLSRDNILGAISIAAFIMSSATWIASFVSGRRRLIITPKLYSHGVPSSEKPALYLLFVMLENKSKLPIAITDIAVVAQGGLVPCDPISVPYFHARTRSGDEITYERHAYSLGLPVAISGLSAASGVLIFADRLQQLESDAKEWTLRLGTTRGAVTQKISLQLPNLHTGFQ